jgi:hypothetical protein
MTGRAATVIVTAVVDCALRGVGAFIGLAGGDFCVSTLDPGTGEAFASGRVDSHRRIDQKRSSGWPPEVFRVGIPR